MTNSKTSQPWQPLGMTVLAYPSKSDAPTITIGKTTISMHSNDTAPSHASSSFLKMRRGGRSTRYSHFERWILYTVNLTRYERHLPRIPLSALDIKDVIRLLRGVAETTDNNATYNLEDTFENNLFKITGSIKNIGRDISLARSVVVS